MRYLNPRTKDLFVINIVYHTPRITIFIMLFLPSLRQHSFSFCDITLFFLSEQKHEIIGNKSKQ